MALKDIMIETQTDLLANPDHAIATFSVNSRQTDTGPNPVEVVWLRQPHVRKLLTGPTLPRLAFRSKASPSRLKVARSARLLRR